MATHRPPPLLDGRGASGPFYDHQYLGFDHAPYGTLYMPAYPTGPYLHSPDRMHQSELHTHDFQPAYMDTMQGIVGDGLSSDDDFSDDEHNAFDDYMHVDLDKCQGKQLAVWSYHMPDILAIFTPVPGDTLATIASFAQSTLKCDLATDGALVLQPGAQRLTQPTHVQSISPDSSVVVVPRHDYLIHMEVTQVKVKVRMLVNLTMTVQSLKAKLQHDRGLPMERMDLLFHDKPLENQRHLFDYQIANGSTVFVLMQLVYDICVVVETFWGKQYKVYVDPCMTTAGLLNVILQRTISKQAGDAAQFFHLFLPRHALVMYNPEGVVMKWASCLGLYGVQDDAVFCLSTIALVHEISLKKVPVLLEDGEVHNFLLSKFDYWSVLALKLHGLLGYPVNLIRLFQGKRKLDLASAVGRYSYHTPAVRVDSSPLAADTDIHHGIKLLFRLGKGLSETITCSPMRTVHSVKMLLEDIGIPNATVYDLFVDSYKLPNSGRIGKVVEEYRKPLDLKLQCYSVFVHGPNAVIYNMKVNANETVRGFKSQVEIKTGLASSDYYLLISGFPLSASDSTLVFKTPLAIRSSVFLMSVHQQQTFFITWDDWLVKLRLPAQSRPSEVQDALRKDHNIPEGSVASLCNFLQWFFAMGHHDTQLSSGTTHNTDTGDDKAKIKRMKRRHKKGLSVPEDDLWNYKILQMKQLQNALERHHNQRHHHRHAWHLQQAPQQQKRNCSQVKKQDAHLARHLKQRDGIFYTTRTHDSWKRLSPEDLVDGYLRALSLPPDVSYPLSWMTQNRHQGKPLKFHSADTSGKCRKAQWCNQSDPLQKNRFRNKARAEQLEPICGRVNDKERRKTRRVQAM